MSSGLDLTGIWIAALCTIGIYSFLYKENPFYRLFEHIYLGLMVGYGIVLTWREFLKPKWWEPMISGFREGNAGILWILAFFIGTLWYFQYSKKYQWLSRLIMGLFMGAGAGMAFKGIFNSIMPQVTSTAERSLNIFSLDLGTWFTNLIFVATIVVVMTYFFFSFEHRHSGVKITAKIGRLMLMVTFGAIFGNTIMARISLVIDRFQFLLINWLHLAH